MLGLCSYEQAFSRCGEWGLLSSSRVLASRCAGFSCCRAGALGAQASIVVMPGLSGLVTLRHGGSSRTRDWTHVPYTGGWTPIHSTTSIPLKSPPSGPCPRAPRQLLWSRAPATSSTWKWISPSQICIDLASPLWLVTLFFPLLCSLALWHHTLPISGVRLHRSQLCQSALFCLLLKWRCFPRFLPTSSVLSIHTLPSDGNIYWNLVTIPRQMLSKAISSLDCSS